MLGMTKKVSAFLAWGLRDRKQLLGVTLLLHLSVGDQPFCLLSFGP